VLNNSKKIIEETIEPYFSTFFRSILYLLNASWAVPLVLLSRLTYPIIKIKFGVCMSNRIGHFINDSLEELTKTPVKKREITLWSTPWGISNVQWYKMIKNYLYISPVYKYVFFWNKCIPGSKRHTTSMTKFSRDRDGQFFSNLIKPKMSDSDVMRSKKLLEQIGWKGEPFICLLSRDDAYLNYLNKIAGQFNNDISFHSYRNSEIETYRLAVNYLLDKGYWVFRMGTLTEMKLQIPHENFLDYSYFEGKCDLLDIYLFSNCAGVISTSTGIDTLSQAYGIPSLIVNGLPLGIAGTFFNTIWVPKKLNWRKTNESLTIKEYIENCFFYTSEYLKAGIDIIDLNEIEILNAVVELIDRIEGREKVDEGEINLQATFIKLLRNWSEFSLYHNFIHPNFKIGSDWILSMKNKIS
jgi:putative glycosyltransferase (TIGR04372 family)